jgi:uncharacterized protein YyaL (SSP411 family)
MQNRLKDETSPYLQAHADNPVHWQPWGEEALAAARAEDKPILLSIGYSACHWCHVMAHESFEDDATAAVMNEHFVNVKVDREERPDLDKVYQLAHQLLTQQTGGWPLTMFLDPQTLLPFFGGTYFPKVPRGNVPGFVNLMERVQDAWTERRERLREQGEKLKAVFQQIEEGPTVEGAFDGPALEAAAIEALQSQYDATEGGFGGAPKFPMASTWAFLLAHAARTKDRTVLDMVMTTLTKMARGGIYDHLGGGFCRYATDSRWMIPHFEKMLYDNGQLLSLYAGALRFGPDALFEGAVTDTAGWLLREMRAGSGGFYAAQDADSEGEEGRYYVWRREEVKRALDEAEYLIVETLYGLDKPANFGSRWNLHRFDAWRSVVERLSLNPEEAEAKLASARRKLLALRQQRPAPGLDDKVLTAWNALTIKGLAEAAVVLGRDDWLEAACACADFLRESLWDGERLFATWKGQARFPGYLDDYANLLDALLALLAARWREADAAFALALGNAAIDAFEDRERGGCFFSAEHTGAGDALFHRPKPTMDDALPPGNGVLARALLGLGHLFGEVRYLDAAGRLLRWAEARVAQYPAGHCTLLGALSLEREPPTQLVLRGPEALLKPWLEAARAAPGGATYGIPYEGTATVPAYLPKLVPSEDRERVVAYLCRDRSCSLPIRSLEDFKAELKQAQPGPRKL